MTTASQMSAAVGKNALCSQIGARGCKSKGYYPKFFKEACLMLGMRLQASVICPSQELSNPLIYQNMYLPFGCDTEREAIKRTIHCKIIHISNISPHSISDKGHCIDPGFGRS